MMVCSLCSVLCFISEIGPHLGYFYWERHGGVSFNKVYLL
jgi:hypothetical protein